jgi:hypothetical protein
MKTIFYVIIVLFLSVQCPFAFTYKINSEELDSWYREGRDWYKKNNCMKTLEYFYTLRRIEYGKHLRNKDIIRDYIESKINDCEGELNFGAKNNKQQKKPIGNTGVIWEKEVIEGTPRQN